MGARYYEREDYRERERKKDRDRERESNGTDKKRPKIQNERKERPGLTITRKRAG